MKIEYNILWVEDEDSWYNITKDIFADTLDDLGFELISKQCRTFDEVKVEISQNNLKDYDLLLVDFTLKGSDTGEKIIDFIRNIIEQPILTDVLFYSSAVENVRDSMRQLGLEGVYTADRKEIDTKFERVVNTTIKKIQDLNNMRGLIMAETSDIEKTMFEIIQIILNQDIFGIKEPLTAIIFENVRKKLSEKNGKFEKYVGKRIDKIITDNLIFDSFEKTNALQFIFDSISHPKALPFKNEVFKTNYSEISKKRNLLGHESQKHNEGKIIIGSGESSFEFNDAFCVDMRKKVKKYGDDLDELLKSIKLLASKEQAAIL